MHNAGYNPGMNSFFAGYTSLVKRLKHNIHDGSFADSHNWNYWWVRGYGRGEGLCKRGRKLREKLANFSAAFCQRKWLHFFCLVVDETCPHILFSCSHKVTEQDKHFRFCWREKKTSDFNSVNNFPSSVSPISFIVTLCIDCLLYTSPSPRDA